LYRLHPWLVIPSPTGIIANANNCEEFNMFTGIVHTYDPAFEVDTSKFSFLNKHLLEVWCVGNNHHHNWLLSWFANIIQRPQKKIGIVVLLWSESESAGKGVIAEWFGKEVIGQKYYTKIDEIGQLTSRFTKHLAGKLFTLCDEIQNYGGAYKGNDLLKNFITSSGSVGGCPLQQARVDPTSTHLYVYDCSLKSISSIYIWIIIKDTRIQGYLDTYKYCILRSSPSPQLYNKHPLLEQELLAGFSSSYCVTFLFQQVMGPR